MEDAGAPWGVLCKVCILSLIYILWGGLTLLSLIYILCPACSVRQSGSWSKLQTEQREVGWANVWKTQGGAVRSLTNIYSLLELLLRKFNCFYIQYCKGFGEGLALIRVGKHGRWIGVQLLVYSKVQHFRTFAYSI